MVVVFDLVFAPMNTSPLALILIGLGGTLGALARYATALWLRPTSLTGFSLATFSVNISGCFALGLLMTVAHRHFWTHHPIVLMLCVGFLGSFTTFSTFSLETLELLQDGRAAAAALYVSSSVIIGLLAVWLGHWLAAR